MKKILTLLAIGLFTITANAQDVKPADKEKEKKEACCAKKASEAKKISAKEAEKCQAKCKADAKKCEASMPKAEGKKCCTKA